MTWTLRPDLIWIWPLGWVQPTSADPVTVLQMLERTVMSRPTSVPGSSLKSTMSESIWACTMQAQAMSTAEQTSPSVVTVWRASSEIFATACTYFLNCSAYATNSIMGHS